MKGPIELPEGEAESDGKSGVDFGHSGTLRCVCRCSRWWTAYCGVVLSWTSQLPLHLVGPGVHTPHGAVARLARFALGSSLWIQDIATQTPL